jgi:hypothetical protein
MSTADPVTKLRDIALPVRVWRRSEQERYRDEEEEGDCSATDPIIGGERTATSKPPNGRLLL